MIYTNSDKQIINYLYKFINEKNICIDICRLKKQIEDFENRKFHIDLWEKIAGSYYSTLDIRNRYRTIIHFTKSDMKYPDDLYFKNTGISYLSRKDLLYFIKNSESMKLFWD